MESNNLNTIRNTLLQIEQLFVPSQFIINRLELMSNRPELMTNRLEFGGESSDEEDEEEEYGELFGGFVEDMSLNVQKTCSCEEVSEVCKKHPERFIL